MFRIGCALLALMLFLGFNAFAIESAEQELKTPNRLQQIGDQTTELAQKLSYQFLESARFMPISRIGNDGQDDVPQKIAIIPPTGFGTDLEREDIWFAVANAFSARPFNILRPFELERHLAVIDQSINGNWQSLSPQELAKRLQVDGLIFVDVSHLHKLYVAAYAHYELSITLSFYDANKDAIIWRKLEQTAEREGSLSLNPLGILITAISSAQVLNEATRQALVDRLARRFEQQIPFPKATGNYVAPPSVELAFSNHAEGPFRAGEEVLVFLKAEPGLIATFDLGQMQQGLVMQETSEGEYLGRYVVNEGDNTKDLVLRLLLQRQRDRSRVDIRIPGRLSLDTTPPLPVHQLTAAAESAGIRLRWQTADDEDNAIFLIEKADSNGRYVPMTEINLTEWLDTDTTPGQRHFYRLTVKDSAGNVSPAREIGQVWVKAGPTEVVSDIEVDTTWYAFAGPYVINKPIKVLRGATLTIEPGTIVNINQSLEVLGRLHSSGLPDAPVLFNGTDKGKLRFLHTGDTEHQLQHTTLQNFAEVGLHHASLLFASGRVSGLKAGLVLHEDSRVAGQYILFSGNEQAITVNNSSLNLQHATFQQNGLALNLQKATHLNLSESKFLSNSQHIVSNNEVNISGVMFDDSDFDTLLTKLSPTVKILWQDVADENNLFRLWLEQQWLALTLALNQQNIEHAIAITDKIAKHIADNTRINELNLLLRSYASKKPLADARTTGQMAINRQLAAKRKTLFYLQYERLPFSAALLESDALLLNQADTRLNAAYLRSHFPELATNSITQLRSSLELPQIKLASFPVSAKREGLFIQTLVLHILDNETLTRKLASVGLTEREPSKLILGLLKNGNEQGLERRLNQGLQQHGYRTIDAGNGSLNLQTQEKMQGMGANIALELKVSVDESTSNLNSNLKLVTLNVDLTLLNLKDDAAPRYLSFSKNTANFQLSQAISLLISEVYTEIEAAILPWLIATELQVTGN